MTPDEFGDALDEQVRQVAEAIAALIVLGGYTPYLAARVVARGQADIVALARPYVDSYVEEYVGEVNPGLLVGVASDGRPLDGLMALPIATANRLRNADAPEDVVARQFLQRAVMLAATQVADAGRIATSLHLTSAPQVRGYQRQLRGSNYCSRCILLSGRIYRWNKGFERHPNCRCVHVAVLYGETPLDLDPMQVFEDMSPEDQNKTFTTAGADAIRDGADIYQVVNARRGMRTTTSYSGSVMRRTYTTFERSSSGRRLMPETIYARAGSRDEAISMLREQGYITGGAQSVAPVIPITGVRNAA